MKIAVITNILPEYRRGLLREIERIKGARVMFFCQRYLKGVSHRTIGADEYPSQIHEVNHYTLGRNKIVFQKLPFLHLLLNYDVFVFTGNPRVITSIFLSFLLKLLGKKIIVWGHVKSIRQDSKLQRIRLTWWRMFDVALTYTEFEKNMLIDLGFPGKVHSINNGLDFESIESTLRRNGISIDADKRHSNGRLLSCCRLIEKNKLGLIIDAIAKIRENFPDIKCSIIGDGPQRDFLINLTDKHNLSDVIEFHGSIYDESELSKHFSEATFLVHPGAIGLSAMHALCYSLPIITHNMRQMHMPEFSVLQDQQNSILYSDTSQLALAIESGLTLSKSEYAEMVKSAKDVACNDHNTRVMARRLLMAAADA